jgi:hypothetical protein
VIARALRRLLVLRATRLAARTLGGGDPTPYEREVASALLAALRARASGRILLGGYRLAMRALVWSAGAWIVLALLAALALWQLHPVASLPAILVAAPAALLVWWRLAWGAPLDWLLEHADPEHEVPIAELPAHLRELAAQAGDGGEATGPLARELEALADRESTG